MPKYFEFEVSLKDISPRIWRRFLLRSTSTFADLHLAIQESFGWLNYHLYEFRTPGREGEPIAGIPDEEYWELEPTPDAQKVKLSRYFGEAAGGTRCLYVYDFGDDWEHDVRLRQIVNDKETFQRRLLAGRRACPPEDCGSTSGYERFAQLVETGVDPWGEDPEEMRMWLGEWRPDAFDLAEAKEAFDR